MKRERIIHIPEDIRGIVEEAYATITDENRESWLKRKLQGLLEENKAKSCTWPAPRKDTFFPAESVAYFDIRDLDDGLESTAEASTRLGDDSIRIAFCDEADYDRYKDHVMSSAEQVAVFLNSVPVRIKPTMLNDTENAIKLQNGKLAGMWLLRGDKTIDLGSCVIINDPMLGVKWEVKRCLNLIQ